MAITIRSPAKSLPLAGLLLLLLLGACGAEQATRQILPAGTAVLAFGDSITHGTGAGSGQDYPARLAELTGWQVINAGIPGDMARDAAARIGPALARHDPELVIIELGGNDFLRQRPAGAVKEDLRRIADAARDHGAEVMLVAVPRLSLARATLGALADSPIYAELAAEEGLLLYPDGLSDVLSDASLRADRIHPNAQGYAQFAAGLGRFLQDIGLAARR